MQFPRQLINVVGAIVVIGIVAAGVLLGALPQYGESARVSSEADYVTSQNGIYQAQVTGLRADEERIDEITAELASLREQIPTVLLQDDVFEIIADAAEATGVTIIAVTAAEPRAWVERTAPLNADTDFSTPENAPAAQEADPAEASTDAGADTTADAEEPAADAEEPAAGAAAAADALAGSVEDAPLTAPQQTVVVTIAAESEDTRSLIDFLDALASGPRLISVAQTALAPGDENVKTLVVNALTFISKES